MEAENLQFFLWFQSFLKTKNIQGHNKNYKLETKNPAEKNVISFSSMLANYLTQLDIDRGFIHKSCGNHRVSREKSNIFITLRYFRAENHVDQTNY